MVPTARIDRPDRSYGGPFGEDVYRICRAAFCGSLDVAGHPTSTGRGDGAKMERDDDNQRLTFGLTQRGVARSAISRYDCLQAFWR